MAAVDSADRGGVGAPQPSIALLSTDVATSAVLLVVAFLWLREMIGRWRSDLEELRSTKDGTVRFVVAALWCATFLIVIFAVRTVANLIGGVAQLA